MRVATASRNARSWVITITAPPKLRSSVFQPGDRVEVEMVGRLVEQQHVGHGDQRLRERDALLHAARQLADEPRAVEMQPVERGVDALLPVPGVERLDARLQRVEVGAFLMRLVGGAQPARLGDALADDVEHARLGVEARLLRHVADGQRPASSAAGRRRAFRCRRRPSAATTCRRRCGRSGRAARRPRARSRRRRAARHGRRRGGRWRARGWPWTQRAAGPAIADQR